MAWFVSFRSFPRPSLRPCRSLRSSSTVVGSSVRCSHCSSPPPSPLTHSAHRFPTVPSSPRSLRVSYGMEWSETRSCEDWEPMEREMSQDREPSFVSELSLHRQSRSVLLSVRPFPSSAHRTERSLHVSSVPLSVRPTRRVTPVPYASLGVRREGRE